MMVIKKDLNRIVGSQDYSSCRLFPADKNCCFRLSQYLFNTFAVWFFHYNKLVESQSKAIRILDKVVEEMNPRRHVSGVLAAARSNLFLNLADHLCPLAPPFLPVQGFIFNAASMGPSAECTRTLRR